jgi:hypothetical protein
VRGVTGKKRRAMMVLDVCHGWGGIHECCTNHTNLGSLETQVTAPPSRMQKECLFGVVKRSENAEIALEKERSATSRSVGW